MPRQVLKKMCKRCEKTFFTYENDKEFCTDICQHKKAYAEHFKVKDTPLTYKIKQCFHCGEDSRKKFCNLHCQKQHGKKQRAQAHNDRIKEGKETIRPKRKGISYEELNRRAEWKRVNEDYSWLYQKNRERI